MGYEGEIMVAIPSLNLDISNKHNIYQKFFSGGKGLRACLTQEVADCLNIPQKQQETLCRIVEYIHQASLLHDDVIDASPTRRGALSGWRQHSIKKAVLAGDYLLAESAQETAKLHNVALIKLTASTLKKLVQGEWLQSEVKNQEETEVLEKVHELKTASLFQWSLRAPFLLKGFYATNLQEHLNKMGQIMGLIFQRADDLLDFDIRNQENKTTFKDMKEGVFNSFALHLLRTVNCCERANPKQLKLNQLNEKERKWRQALKSCHSLKEVKKLIGDKTFEIALKEFDKISQQKIKAFKQEIKPLEKYMLLAPTKLGFLNEDPSKKKAKGYSWLMYQAKKVNLLTDILTKWPDKLYWRK